jgi:opacity protein-like surface antigen
MLFDARGSGFFRGNWELAPEVFGAGIWTSYGSYMAGCTLWLRQNFVQPGWKVTPFLQLGCGIGLSDIPHQFVGQDFSFNLDSSAGLRYFISPRLSVNAEFRYQHFSNANTASHNVGINAIGPMFGVSWIF